MLAAALLWAWMPATAAASTRDIARLDAQRPAPVVLRGAARPVTLQLAFDLPPGARQGPDRWYLVRLHYRLWFARDSGRGFAWVTADTDGRTSAQVEYTTTRRGGALHVRRTTLDLEHGQRERHGKFTRDVVTFTNYLQFAGVRPGANTWTIRLEQMGGARVRRLELLGDTAIRVTTRTPFPLTVSAVSGPRSPRVGERFTVRAVVAARRGTRAGHVTVRAAADPAGVVRLVTPAVKHLGAVGGRPRSVPFTFLARAAGDATITFSVTSNRNHPHASASVRILPAGRRASAPALAWAVAAIPAIGMAGWLVGSRRRKQRTS